MNRNIILPILELSLLGLAISHLLNVGIRANLKRKFRPFSPPSPEKLKEWVLKYGTNTNSFMTLYPGFEYFGTPDLEGVIPYVDTPSAWVGAGEPLGPPENHLLLLDQFAKVAASIKKRILIIPVQKEFAERAKEKGYHPLLVGSEPTFLLAQYPRTGQTWVDVIPTAKQISAKGAKVIEFRPEQLSKPKREEYELMVSDWLGTRKSATLGFLNQVDPWIFSEDKRYFAVEISGKTLAFVAAIPVKARNGWYLIDVIRKKESPPGSTELLLLQAMRALRESGAEHITMGVCPLSGMEEANHLPLAQKNLHRVVYRLFKLMYERGNQFYNFKTLHQFKLKFQPTQSEPVFLIYRDDHSRSKTLGLKDIISISQAWLPRGLAHATGSGIIRALSRIDLSKLIKSQLSSSVVVRSVPPSWQRLVYRCRLTCSLLLLNLIAYFLTTDLHGLVYPALEVQWSYSWLHFLQNPLQALLFSPFLHWHLAHLFLNIFTMVLFTGGLEYLAGTPITAATYFVPMILSNPVTSVLLLGVGKYFFPGINALEGDLGASLGIFGTAGALYSFLRFRNTFVLILLTIVLIDTVDSGILLTLNHFVALGLGLVISKFMLQD